MSVDDFSTIKPRHGLQGHEEHYKYMRVALRSSGALAKSGRKFRLSDRNEVEVPVEEIINENAVLQTSRIDAKRVDSLLGSRRGPQMKFNSSIG